LNKKRNYVLSSLKLQLCKTLSSTSFSLVSFTPLGKVAISPASPVDI